jgi:hypothetical protein
MVGVVVALALVSLGSAESRARGIDRLPESAPVFVQQGPDDNEVVWLEDQMCFCDWQHAPAPPVDRYHAVPGVPVPVRDDFDRPLVESVEGTRF